jgi:anaerobic selenocysteine-containing dehydrogenase
VVAREIIDAKYTARGNTLFVVDPRRSNTAWYASTHVQNRPGTEALILVAALKSLKSSGKLASDSHPWLDSLDEKALLEAAGVGRDVVARLAHAFADAAKAAIVIAPSARGVGDVALVARLAALLAQTTGGQKGFVSLPSGGNVLGAQQVVAKGGWMPASQLVAEMAAGKYRALINLGADLTASYPSAALSKSLASLDAVVSYSLFRGETERVSSVVLGAASWLESDGSAVRFDGSVAEWKAVGAPSWGTRTLTDVLSQLEAALGSVPASKGAAPAGVPDVQDDALAARVEAVRRAAEARASGEMSFVALPATGHMGAGAITRWMDWAREMFPAGFAEISQADAAAAGINEKDCIVLSSPFAQVELSARLTDRLQAGVVAVPAYDPAARSLFSWQPGADGWFDTGPGGVRLSRKQS